MDHNFKDQIIVVTGGTGALGSEVSELFVKYSPRVIVVTYRSESERANTEKRLKNKISDHDTEKNSTIIEFVRVDVLNEEEIRNLVNKIINKFGQIHALTNIVGGYFGGKTVGEVAEEEWDRMMDLNLKSAFLISKHVVESMKRHQFGKIVHVSSASGEKASGRDSAYAASKAALIRMVESIKEEVKEFKININCVLPTIIDTSANRLAMPSADFTKWVKPKDLARLIVFLCSEDSKVLNGDAIKTSSYG
ncbi:MAG TPA: SDR family NAD(P)-dependent oxidoreductase [Candidatus Nitrosocosmicus sp.]|nr:SDR family NAD(P)-dependent oxidoreductase [Candidatus Nitrosocosmicus sp.]